MLSSASAIRVDGLSKCYQIYDRPENRLKDAIVPRIQRLFGLTPSRYARPFWALNNISLDIKKGQTVGIIGLNGSGKSTLLQIIAGTLTPTSGSVEVEGRVAALLELGSGFNPEFSGRENVYLNGAVLGLTSAEIDARYQSIAEFADIGDFIEQPVKTYSSGMVVRLAFAVIAHVDADVLVIDEALSVGDAYFVQKCMRFLRAYMQRGTLLFCSHDAAAIVSLCDHAVLLAKGEMVMQGSPKDVTEKYLATLYASEQKMNVKAKLDAPAVHNAVEALETAPQAATDAARRPQPIDYRDMRIEKFNQSTLRNDIEIFKFNSEADSFGTRLAKIISVIIFDEHNAPLAWVVGGEDVRLEVRAQADDAIAMPIIGFSVKNRLGQVIFADNTYESYRTEQLNILEGQIIVAAFTFRMPILPNGDYSIAVAVASGTQENNVQHHWMHDALIMRVHASFACFGLMGIPIRKISLTVAS